MISTSILIAAGISPGAAHLHAPPLQDAAELFKIDTPDRVAAFLGQSAHETGGFKRFEENLNYTRAERILEIFRKRVRDLADAQTLVRKPIALANRVYAGRFGNGDEASGDGWRYRGRGGVHLTFKDNYAAAGKALNSPYVDNPGLVALPDDAALTLGWFWAGHGCNELADAWDIDGITQRINPGMAGAEERRTWSARFRAALAE